MSLPTRRLGHSGVEVTTIAFGAMMFGRWGNTDVDECHRMVDRAIEAGITLFDTADMYDDGAVRDDPRRGPAWPPRPSGAGDQGRQPDGRRSAAQRPVTALDQAGLRRQPAPAAGRPHRPVPDAPTRSRDTDRRDAHRVRRARHGRQGRRDRYVDVLGRADRRRQPACRRARRGTYRRASSRRTQRWRAGSSTRCCRRAAATTSASSCGHR